ncbi:MAG TPA: response regulator [Candidatus Omnitrophota bacterium]|nr:response regulator [Candidatus Omnitrophota bacterium]
MFNRLKSFFKKAQLSSTSLSGRRILVVEDETAQRLTLERILQKEGVHVVSAENGEQGLRKAVEFFPDVILLDERMPVMSGADMCRELKKHEVTRDIPVIFLTAADSPEDVVEHFELGAEIHLAKPINAKELISQILISLNTVKE